MADFSKEATKFLISQPVVVAAVSTFNSGKPYIFHRKPGDNIEKANKTAVVVMDGGYFGDPVDYHTTRFKRLRLEFWAGPLRDARGLAVNGSEACDRLDAAWNAVDKVLHRVNSETQVWGSIVTITSQRIGDLVTYPLEDGSEMCYGTCFYGIQFYNN